MAVKQTVNNPHFGVLFMKYFDSLSFCVVQDYNLAWDPNVLSPSSQFSNLYIQAPLAVVITWDTATKQRLFLENFVMQKQADGKVIAYFYISVCSLNVSWLDSRVLNMSTVEMYLFPFYSLGSDCERLVNKQHIFEYFISHTDQSSAIQFLMSMVPSLEDPTPCPSYVPSLLSALSHATSHVHNAILDELAR